MSITPKSKRNFRVYLRAVRFRTGRFVRRIARSMFWICRRAARSRDVRFLLLAAFALALVVAISVPEWREMLGLGLVAFN